MSTNPYVVTLEGDPSVGRNGNSRPGGGIAASQDFASPVAVMRRYIESLPPEIPFREEIRTFRFWKAVRTEFLATLLLVIFGCGSCLPWKVPPSTDVNLLTIEIKAALAFGVTVATLVQCFGPISGGHMNPAVSLSFLVIRHISPLRATLYVVAQCLGGVCGAAILYGLTPETLRPTAGLGATEPDEELHLSQAFGLEFLGTLVAVLTVLASLDPRRTDAGIQALSIGLAYTVAHLLTMSKV